MRAVWVLLVLVLPVTVLADWTEADTAREVCYLSVLAVDMLQTHDIDSAGGHFEKNVILGKAPKPIWVNVYFAACAVGHYAVSKWVPNKYREFWQVVTIGLETKVINKNYKYGLYQSISIAYYLTYTVEI